MYKTIKIPETAYKRVKHLKEELSKDEAISGLRKVSLSETVSYAITQALENLERRHKLKSAAGGWSDLNAKKLIKDIYASRLKNTRKEVHI